MTQWPSSPFSMPASPVGAGVHAKQCNEENPSTWSDLTSPRVSAWLLHIWQHPPCCQHSEIIPLLSPPLSLGGGSPPPPPTPFATQPTSCFLGYITLAMLAFSDEPEIRIGDAIVCVYLASIASRATWSDCLLLGQPRWAGWANLEQFLIYCIDQLEHTGSPCQGFP